MVSESSLKTLNQFNIDNCQIYARLNEPLQTALFIKKTGPNGFISMTNPKVPGSLLKCLSLNFDSSDNRVWHETLCVQRTQAFNVQAIGAELVLTTVELPGLPNTADFQKIRGPLCKHG